MSHGVPFFVWREGRPRWVPSPQLRQAGWKGRDLKDGHGAWLPLEPALDMARQINVRAGLHGVIAKPAKPRKGDLSAPAPSAAGRAGYVYFLWLGNKVKIGFSVDPFARVAHMRTGFPQAPEAMAAVEGSQADERFLHYRLRKDRLSGEWFHSSRDVLWTMMRCLRSRRIVRTKGAEISASPHDESHEVVAFFEEFGK